MLHSMSFTEKVGNTNADVLESTLYNEKNLIPDNEAFCEKTDENTPAFALMVEGKIDCSGIDRQGSYEKGSEDSWNYFDGANLLEPAIQSSPKTAVDFHKQLVVTRQRNIESLENFVVAEQKLLGEGFRKVAINNVYINTKGEIRSLACCTDTVVDYQYPTAEEEPALEQPSPCEYPNNASYSRRFYDDEFGRMNYCNAIDLLAMHLRALATPSESKLNKTKHIQMGNGFTSDDLGCIALDLYRSMNPDPFALARKRLYLITFDPKSTDKDNLPNKKYPKYSTYTIKGRNVGRCHFSDTVIEICGALKDFGIIASSKKDICELIAKGSLDKSSTTDSSIASKISSTSRPLHATKQFDTEMIMLLTYTVNAYFCTSGKI